MTNSEFMPEEEMYDDYEEKVIIKSTSRGYRYRQQKKAARDKRLRRIISNSRHHYRPNRGYIDYGYVNGEWVPVGKYVKYPRNSERQKFCKKQSNKKVRALNRKISEESLAHIPHKKVYDYWWNVY